MLVRTKDTVAELLELDPSIWERVKDQLSSSRELDCGRPTLNLKNQPVQGTSLESLDSQIAIPPRLPVNNLNPTEFAQGLKGSVNF
jgi:hypothetical protein